MIMISVAFRLRILYINYNDASQKDSWTFQTYIRVSKKLFDRNEIARYLSQHDAAFRRCWQESVNNGNYQDQTGTDRPRATIKRENRAIVAAAVTAPDSLISTIHCEACTHVSNMTLGTWKKKRNLCAHVVRDVMGLGGGWKEPALTVASHTSVQKSVMVWGVISFNRWPRLV